MSGTLQTVLHLLWTFSQLSVLGFGGGKGIIPQMHADAVDHYHWVTSEQFTRVLYDRQAGARARRRSSRRSIGYAATPARPYIGAAVATVGMFVPSSLIMVAFDALWDRFQASPWRTIISRGLAPAIVGLVWSSVWTIGRGTTPLSQPPGSREMWSPAGRAVVC